jgi:hypothetical protein
MKTDWNTIRGMMNAAIDACERIEASQYKEKDRDATVDVNGQLVSVQDLLVSAWTYPERLRYQIIRDRHDAKADVPYIPETARILLAMSQAAAELIDAGEVKPAKDAISKMIAWFEDHLSPNIEAAVASRRGE